MNFIPNNLDSGVSAYCLIDENNEWQDFVITAYTDDYESCQKSDGITASGLKVKYGHIAADYKYPFGTIMHIENLGYFIVTDRGGAITENKIDIYFNTAEEAWNFGKRIMRVKVYRSGGHFEDN
jgi:3D (Asp-Asp-Asp) domain-containing protein